MAKGLLPAYFVRTACCTALGMLHYARLGYIVLDPGLEWLCLWDNDNLRPSRQRQKQYA